MVLHSARTLYDDGVLMRHTRGSIGSLPAPPPTCIPTTPSGSERENHRPSSSPSTPRPSWRCGSTRPSTGSGLRAVQPARQAGTARTRSCGSRRSAEARRDRSPAGPGHLAEAAGRFRVVAPGEGDQRLWAWIAGGRHDRREPGSVAGIGTTTSPGASSTSEIVITSTPSAACRRRGRPSARTWGRPWRRPAPEPLHHRHRPVQEVGGRNGWATT